MATFAEVEDLRDWFIDNCGEMCAKVNALDGDEPAGMYRGEQTHAGD